MSPTFLTSGVVTLLLPRQVFSLIDLSDSPVSRFLARSPPPGSPLLTPIRVVGSISLPLRQVSPSSSLVSCFLLFLTLRRLASTRSFFLLLFLFFAFYFSVRDEERTTRGDIVGRTERLSAIRARRLSILATRGRLLLPPLRLTCKPARGTLVALVTARVLPLHTRRLAVCWSTTLPERCHAVLGLLIATVVYLKRFAEGRRGFKGKGCNSAKDRESRLSLCSVCGRV